MKLNFAERNIGFIEIKVFVFISKSHFHRAHLLPKAFVNLMNEKQLTAAFSHMFIYIEHDFSNKFVIGKSCKLFL